MFRLSHSKVNELCKVNIIPSFTLYNKEGYGLTLDSCILKGVV